MRVVNVEKREDGVQGSRYLLELELRDANGLPLRLSQYVYTLNSYSRQHEGLRFKRSKPEVLLCNPVGFHWNPVATVHFIVPGTVHPHVTVLAPLTFGVVLFVGFAHI